MRAGQAHAPDPLAQLDDVDLGQRVRPATPPPPIGASPAAPCRRCRGAAPPTAGAVQAARGPAGYHRLAGRARPAARERGAGRCGPPRTRSPRRMPRHPSRRRAAFAPLEPFAARAAAAALARVGLRRGVPRARAGAAGRLRLPRAARAAVSRRCGRCWNRSCATAGCTVPWVNDEAALKLEDSELLEVPGKPGQIALQARIRNLSPSAQEFPAPRAHAHRPHGTDGGAPRAAPRRLPRPRPGRRARSWPPGRRRCSACASRPAASAPRATSCCSSTPERASRGALAQVREHRVHGPVDERRVVHDARLAAAHLLGERLGRDRDRRTRLRVGEEVDALGGADPGEPRAQQLRRPRGGTRPR